MFIAILYYCHMERKKSVNALSMEQRMRVVFYFEQGLSRRKVVREMGKHGVKLCGQTASNKFIEFIWRRYQLSGSVGFRKPPGRKRIQFSNQVLRYAHRLAKKDRRINRVGAP